jgi:Family of unknown function (DUF6703)
VGKVIGRDEQPSPEYAYPLPVSLPFRSRVEHAAYPVLDRLERLPRLVPFLCVLALLVVGIFVPRWGFIATGLVAMAVAFLLYYTWPRLTLPERLLRSAVLGIVVAVTVVQAFPRS